MKSNPAIKEEIIKTSTRLFFSKGYKKVTVDDIAEAMSISKKTIYKYYKSKREILERTFDDYRHDISEAINEIIDRKGITFPEKLKEVMTCIGVRVGSLSPILFKDIQENIPDLWRKINQYKQEAAFLRFNKLIEDGRKKGHIKEEVNRGVIIALYASAIENLLDPEFIQNLPRELSREIPEYPYEIFDNALKIIYEGILTPDTLSSLKKLEST